MSVCADGKPFAAGMEGELDFEVLSPEREKNEKLEEQLPNEVESQASKTEESEKTLEKKDPSNTAEKGNESKAEHEEGEDDGECSDDEDLEEGELKEVCGDETAPKKAQVCRFYNRGICFYGSTCRFLHLNNDMKGNYNMFLPHRSAHSMMIPPSPHGMHRSAPRSGPDFMPVPPMLPAPVDIHEESAWEKGLKEAKELLKKANMRKEDTDYEDKRLTLSLSHLSNAERNPPINDKEYADKFGYRKKNRDDLYKYGEPPPAYNRPHFGVSSRYENFEIRYTQNVDRGMRSRRFNQKRDGDFSRMDHPNMNKIRPDDFFDPWRRSKSPKHRKTSKDRERSRSFGGSPFSSVSSYSSRSSSYSRSSSSMSRGLSSRSPSPSDKKAKTPFAPNKNLYPLSPKDTANKGNKNPVGAKKKRTSSSRSRSISRGRSMDSRSSRSLSMDSVSSASSSVSHSSHTSGESAGRPEHVSILRRQDEKPPEKEKPEVASFPLSPPAGGSFYFQIPNPVKTEHLKQNIGLPDMERDPLEESFQMSQVDNSFPPSIQHLMPMERERAKDPIKGLHPPKQQIKLTLLNKNPQSKLSNFPKKELEGIKGEEAPKIGGFLHGIKRPLSPPVPPVAIKPQPAIPKKSASSRRDELLKQLKAVEDAIARKRAKFC